LTEKPAARNQPSAIANLSFMIISFFLLGFLRRYPKTCVPSW
jgi:hypothetical protein